MSLAKRKPGLTFLVADELLTKAGRNLTWEAWTTWTEIERREAADWAAMAHVRGKTLPEHVKGLENVKMGASA